MQVSTSVASKHGQTGVKTHSSASNLTMVLNWAFSVHTTVFQPQVYQGSHRLEKALNLEQCLEKALNLNLP